MLRFMHLEFIFLICKVQVELLKSRMTLHVIAFLFFSLWEINLFFYSVSSICALSVDFYLYVQHMCGSETAVQELSLQALMEDKSVWTEWVFAEGELREVCYVLSFNKAGALQGFTNISKTAEKKKKTQSHLFYQCDISFFSVLH